jgi:hypothetical protein
MSGGGAFPGGHNPLNKIQRELQSALKLLFKEVGQQSIALLAEPVITSFETTVYADIDAMALNPPDVAVSEDPIRVLSARRMPVTQAPLLEHAEISGGLPCQFAAVAVQAPVLEKMSLVSVGVPFNNMLEAQSIDWPVEALGAAVSSTPMEDLTAQSRQWAVARFAARLSSFLEHFTQCKTFDAGRFYALPVRKSPILPHRFSLAVREQFRQALAEKAETSVRNIQLRLVYERLDMSLFAAIQQDEQGHLLCTPKNEVLGRNRKASSDKESGSRSPEAEAYLVYGFRLDDRQEFRALVPLAKICQLRKEGPSC